MTETLEILGVEQDGKDGVIVKFSDGTVGMYVSEELVALRPNREQATPNKTVAPTPPIAQGEEHSGA